MKRPSIELDVNGVILKAKLSGGKSVYHWGGYMFKHTLTLMVGERKTTFSYYDHRENPTGDDIKDALECIVSDAFCGWWDYESFADEFGYSDTENRVLQIEAHRVYRGCVRSMEQMESLGFNEDDLTKIRELVE